MNNLLNKSFIAFIFTSILFFTSCSEEDKVFYPIDEKYLRIEDISSTYISSSGGNISFDIISNTSWSIRIECINSSVSYNYARPSISSSSGDSKDVRINVASNQKNISLTFKVYIEYVIPPVGDIKTETFTFTQAANANADTGGNTGSGTGGNTGSGTGGTTITKPSAPSSLYVDNYGNTVYPDVRISWGAVNGATKYKVYRSTSAYGSYTLLGTAYSTNYSDANCKIGNVYYYKVKAVNSAGESDYSSYVSFNFKDNRKPGPASYGYCYVSGYNMTLNWSAPTGSSYGKPTKVLIRALDSVLDEYITVATLSGDATSYTFKCLPYITDGRYVYVGVLLENENGSGGGSAKVYDFQTSKWIN